MKIGCDSCGAQYDIDDGRISPAGIQMKCPACSHQFTVKKPPAALELPSDDDEPELPAPKVAAPKAPSGPHAILSAPKPPLALGALDADDDADLPTPVKAGVRAEPRPDEDLIDLPAPRAKKPTPTPPMTPLVAERPSTLHGAPSPPKPATTPATPSKPKVERPSTLHGTPPAPAPAKKPVAAVDEIVDVVAPKVDLPAPKLPAMRRPADDLVDLPAVRQAPGVDLDAADEEDAALLAPKPKPLTPPVEIDVVAPLEAPAGRVAPGLESLDGVEPRNDAELPTPRTGGMELTPKPVAPAEPVVAEQPIAKPVKTPKPPSVLRRRALLAAGGVVGLVVVMGVGMGLFTSTGFFGVRLWSGQRAQNEARLAAARKLLGDDTVASYRKAGLDLRLLAESEPTLIEAAGLEACARLWLAFKGVTAEQKAATAALDKLALDPKNKDVAEIARADALRALVLGKPQDVRTKVKAILAKGSDAGALAILGWAEVGAGDFKAAGDAFTKSLAADAARAGTLFGAGLVAERSGDNAKAGEFYGRALARSPQHFGAKVGQLRLAGDGGALDDLVQKRGAQAAPHELADAWASLGVVAERAGRADDAEDRYKRAIAADAAGKMARLGLLRVQCDAGRCKDGLVSAQRLLQDDSKDDQVRLLLARAQLDVGAVEEAQKTLQPLAKSTDARVLWVRGRAAASRDDAVKLYRESVAADPKLTVAHLALSQTLMAMGKNDEAQAALQAAEAQAAADPQMMLELGQAWMRLNKPAEAEPRLRAAAAKLGDVAQLALGEALEAQGKLDDAQAVYDGLATKSPDAPGLAERRARVLSRRGHKAEAWAIYEKALAATVATSSLRAAAAETALDLGRTADAQKLAQQVLATDERSAHAWLVQARLHLASGHTADALVAGRRSASFQDLPEAHLVVAHVLDQSGKLDQAMVEYNLARRPPVEGEASLGRARLLVRMGATRDAVAELTALGKDPKLKARAALLLGDSLSDLNQRDKARHAYEDALKAAATAPTDEAAADASEAAFKLGRGLVDAGKSKDALPLLQRAAKEGGDKVGWAAEAWLLLGDIHREEKKPADAIAAYNKYLTLAPADASARAEVRRHLTILGAPTEKAP